jgi:hypothetical protein
VGRGDLPRLTGGGGTSLAARDHRRATALRIAAVVPGLAIVGAGTFLVYRRIAAASPRWHADDLGLSAELGPEWHDMPFQGGRSDPATGAVAKARMLRRGDDINAPLALLQIVRASSSHRFERDLAASVLQRMLPDLRGELPWGPGALLGEVRCAMSSLRADPMAACTVDEAMLGKRFHVALYVWIADEHAMLTVFVAERDGEPDEAGAIARSIELD